MRPQNFIIIIIIIIIDANRKRTYNVHVHHFRVLQWWHDKNKFMISTVGFVEFLIEQWNKCNDVIYGVLISVACTNYSQLHFTADILVPAS